MPLCDSSETCTRAVRPDPSPAVLRRTGTAGIPEVSRFSCMKFLGVRWGLRLRRTERELALTFPFMLPSAHYKDVGVRIASFVGSRTGAVSLGPAYLGLPVSSGSGLTSGTLDRFPVPATSNVESGFPALRSPVGFTSRSIRPRGQVQLSRVRIVSAYSH
jgi:hypothetical protein